MNRCRHVAAVLVLSWCFDAMAPAQEAASSREADHQALRQMLATVTTAVNNQDVKPLTAVLAKEFVITTVDQTVMTNREAFAAYYHQMFTDAKGPIAKMTIAPEADILTRFPDANTGYCYGSALATYTLKDGQVFKIKERWTAVVVKEGGEWKLAAVHRGVNFLDNPVLRARSMSFWQKLGVWLHLAKMPSD